MFDITSFDPVSGSVTRKEVEVLTAAHLAALVQSVWFIISMPSLSPLSYNHEPYGMCCTS